MKLLGSIIYVTSAFYRFAFEESLLSTLDSLLFCIFIITQISILFKWGCSIRKKYKSRIKCGWTNYAPYDMIFMLGGLLGCLFC